MNLRLDPNLRSAPHSRGNVFIGLVTTRPIGQSLEVIDCSEVKGQKRYTEICGFTPETSIAGLESDPPIGTFIYLETNCVLDNKPAFPTRGTR